LLRYARNDEKKQLQAEIYYGTGTASTERLTVPRGGQYKLCRTKSKFEKRNIKRILCKRMRKYNIFTFFIYKDINIYIKILLTGIDCSPPKSLLLMKFIK